MTFAVNDQDRWILADHASLIDISQFGVAAKFALAMVLLLQPFTMWWSPHRFDVPDSPGGQEKAVRFIAPGIVLALIIAVFISLVSPLLINRLLPDSYAMAGQYSVGLILLMLFREVSELVNAGCFIGKTTGNQCRKNLTSGTLCHAHS